MSLNAAQTGATQLSPLLSTTTVLQAIETGEKRLIDAGVAFGHGTDNAFDEAAWLVLWALELPLDSQLSDALENTESVANRRIVQYSCGIIATLFDDRIRTRKPAAYLTKEAWLQGIPFYVDERCIVPRSFIAELLADGSLDPWLSPTTTSALDLCTGNGSLAVLCAMAYPDVQVDAADLSEAALEVAVINVAKHQLQSRVRMLQGDGLNACKAQDGQSQRYDLILCNPPYVNACSMALLPPEYQNEPAMALASGQDGMDFIRTLIPSILTHMTPNAVFVLEIGNEREHFEAAFPGIEAVWLETSAGEDQVLLLTPEALAPFSKP